MSKATKVIFSLGTKRTLVLFYMRLSSFSVALKKKKKKNVKEKTTSMTFLFYWLKVSSDLFSNFNPYLWGNVFLILLQFLFKTWNDPYMFLNMKEDETPLPCQWVFYYFIYII